MVSQNLGFYPNASRFKLSGDSGDFRYNGNWYKESTFDGDWYIPLYNEFDRSFMSWIPVEKSKYYDNHLYGVSSQRRKKNIKQVFNEDSRCYFTRRGSRRIEFRWFVSGERTVVYYRDKHGVPMFRDKRPICVKDGTEVTIRKRYHAVDGDNSYDDKGNDLLEDFNLTNLTNFQHYSNVTVKKSVACGVESSPNLISLRATVIDKGQLRVYSFKDSLDAQQFMYQNQKKFYNNMWYGNMCDVPQFVDPVGSNSQLIPYTSMRSHRWDYRCKLSLKDVFSVSNRYDVCGNFVGEDTGEMTHKVFDDVDGSLPEFSESYNIRDELTSKIMEMDFG